jgi:hypothetical protein
MALLLLSRVLRRWSLGVPAVATGVLTQSADPLLLHDCQYTEGNFMQHLSALELGPSAPKGPALILAIVLGITRFPGCVHLDIFLNLAITATIMEHYVETAFHTF